jgi:hypothetical protein
VLFWIKLVKYNMVWLSVKLKYHFVWNIRSNVYYDFIYLTKKGQTQCQRLPHEWGMEKRITEAKSYPRRNSTERRLRTQNLVTRRANTHQLHQACPSLYILQRNKIFLHNNCWSKFSALAKRHADHIWNYLFCSFYFF